MEIGGFNITKSNKQPIEVEIPEFDFECIERGVKIPLNYGLGMKMERDGIIMNPPPAPTKPLINPIIAPNITKMVGRFFLVEGSSF